MHDREEPVAREHPLQLDAGPARRARAARPEPVLGVQRHRQAAEPLVELRPRPAAHDVHPGVRPRRECREQREEVGVGCGIARHAGEGHQRPVVVEEQHQRPRLARARQCRLDHLGRRHRRRAAAAVGAGSRAKIREEGNRPGLGGRRGHVLAERLHPRAPFPLAHGERAMQGVRGAVHVVGIDQDGLGQLLGGAGELAQHQDAAQVGAGGDEFLGDQVHPVAERRHEHHVGGDVERRQVNLVEAPVDVAHRRPVRRPEGSVDAADGRLHLGAELAVAPHRLARRHHHLDEPHLAVQLGMAHQQPLEREQPARDALGVVEPVHAGHHLHAVAAERPRLGAHLRPRGERAVPLGVDPDRVRLDDHVPAALPDHAAARLRGEQGTHRRLEMVGVGLGVEADDVGAQQPLEHLAAPGEDPEDVGRGEGDVQEEADARAGEPPAQQLGHEHELVIVHPDLVSLAPVLRHPVREALVDRRVGAPVLGRQGQPLGLVVQQRPEHAVGDFLVVLPDLATAEPHRHAIQRPKPLLELRGMAAAQLAGGAGPPDPERRRRAGGAGERRGQPADAALDLELAVGLARGDRQAVGDQDDARGGQVHARTLPSRASSSSPMVIAAWMSPTCV